MILFGQQLPALTVMKSTGPGRFLTAAAYPAGTSPTRIAVADFNGDSNLDVAALGTSASVAVLLGDGKGRLGPVHEYPLSSAATAFAAADVNGDGKQDLVFAGSNLIQTLPGNGDGTFGAAITSPCFLCGIAVIVADVNHDGKLDVITGSGLGLAVSLGNGDGTFQKPSIYSFYRLSSIAVADLNGDGNLDVVVSQIRTKNSGGGVYIFFGNSNGTFGSPLLLNTAGIDAIIGDFNNDGIPDIATGYNFSAAIYLGNGDGTFQPPLLQGGYMYPPLLAADMNGDGN